MNPQAKLLVATVILLLALGFFFLGPSLVGAPDDAADPTPASRLNPGDAGSRLSRT